MRHRLWVISVAVAACGETAPVSQDAASPDALVNGDGGEPDGATCTPPEIIDAAPVDSAASCTANGVPGSCVDVASCYGARKPTAGLCAGPANIQCCTPRFAEGITCDPNVEAQPNACLVEEPGDASCPPGMARVAAFCIDRFEAALVDAATGEPLSPYFPPRGRAARAVSLRGAVPQGYISQPEAAAACAAAGKRLCTDTEWKRACQGADGATYPYGDTRQPGVCNDARGQHPAIELYGTSAAWIYAHIDSPCLNQLADGLAPTGAHAGCVTAEQVYDLMGNLHEWTADPAGTFRGGFYVDTKLNGNGCLYVTTAHDVSHWDYSTGFRCCADPP